MGSGELLERSLKEVSREEKGGGVKGKGGRGRVSKDYYLNSVKVAKFLPAYL